MCGGAENITAPSVVSIYVWVGVLGEFEICWGWENSVGSILVVTWLAGWP